MRLTEWNGGLTPQVRYCMLCLTLVQWRNFTVLNSLAVRLLLIVPREQPMFLYIASIQCESKKSPPPDVIWIFSFFSQTVKTFQLIYLRTYYTSLCTPDYEFLFSYLQVWRSYAILSATTYLVHIICAKCPKRTKTRAFRRLRKSFIGLLIVVCGKSL